MTEDQFDTLVDDATHAVNNLIPDRTLDGLDITERSALLFRINDALTPILRDAIGTTEDAPGKPTRAVTIAAMLGELIETHTAKCDESSDHEEDRPAHVISEVHGTSANIDSIASCETGTGSQIYLVLDDGTNFRINVEAI